MELMSYDISSGSITETQRVEWVHVFAYSSVVSIEVRVERVVRPVRVGRTGPQVAPVTLVVEALPPVAGEDPSPGRHCQYCSLYCAQRTGAQ